MSCSLPWFSRAADPMSMKSLKFCYNKLQLFIFFKSFDFTTAKIHLKTLLASLLLWGMQHMQIYRELFTSNLDEVVK